MGLPLNDRNRKSMAQHGFVMMMLPLRIIQTTTGQGESEGLGNVLVTVSFLRTLRRANARNCDWVHDPNLDMSALKQVAGQRLRQTRCYDAAAATMEAARDLPEEEREVISQNAMLMLLSETEDCSIPEEESEEFTSVSEDEMEEEMDEDTDVIFDSLSDEGSTSLLQQEQSPWANAILRTTITAGRHVGWDIGLWVGMFLLMIVWGILCGFLMEFIRRALRWMRCSILYREPSCYGAPPPNWFRHVIRAGCTVAGAFFGFADTFEFALR